MALRLVLPAVLLLAVAAAGTCYYYGRVTGNPLRMPYQEARDQYATARIFLWERPNARAGISLMRQMRDFYLGWELTKFLEAKSLAGLVHNSFGKAGAFWMFFLGPALTLPLLFGWRLFGDRRVRPLLAIGGVCVAGLAVNTWFYAHYAAPMTGLIYVLVLQGMRHLRVWRRTAVRWDRPPVPSPWFAWGWRCCACASLSSFYMPPDWPMTWYYTRPGTWSARAYCRDWKRMPGRQLAIVHYRPEHNFFEEWVYNAASIDDAKVVWAHEMDDANNRELTRYFDTRHVWLVDADATPPTVSPYPSRP